MDGILLRSLTPEYLQSKEKRGSKEAKTTTMSITSAILDRTEELMAGILKGLSKETTKEPKWNYKKEKN